MTSEEPHETHGDEAVQNEVRSTIVEIFESNPFRKAGVATLTSHLAAHGLEVSEPDVRNTCEELVEEDVLEFDHNVHSRAKYVYVNE